MLTKTIWGAIAFLLTGLPLAAPAMADPGVYSDQDATFYRSLANPNVDGGALTVSNPGLVREQGLEICQKLRNGMRGIDAVRQLMVEGPYPFNSASRIAVAAHIAYCPDEVLTRSDS